MLCCLRRRTRKALFGVGAATLLLLFAGIHNAWDAVAYHVFVNMRPRTLSRVGTTPQKKRSETQGIKGQGRRHHRRQQ